MGGLELPLLTLLLLVGAAFAAGLVDSIVGGGGLIQLPALLLGLPDDTPVPTVAGTNKVPSSLGTAVAAWTYLRRIAVTWSSVLPLVAFSAVGSALGAQLTHLLRRQDFLPLVLLAVVAVGWFTWRRPHLGLAPQLRHTGRAAHVRHAGIGLAVGLWDGFVGPGTGTFFLIALVGVLGYEFLHATTLAKLANLTTNLAAIGVFASSGNVLWGLALAMGAANLAGGLLGARTALRRGNAFVRRVFLAMVVVLGGRLAWEWVGSWVQAG